MAVEPSETSRSRCEGQAQWWTSYALNRAIREHEGTLHDDRAVLGFERWYEPLEKWLSHHGDWAESQGLYAEDLFEIMDSHWADSCGAHRDPLQAAIDEYTYNPAVIGFDCLKTDLRRRCASFCLALAKAANEGGRFFLSQENLGEVLDCSSAGARGCLKNLEQLGMIERTRIGYRKGGESIASEWVLRGELLQFSSFPDPNLDSGYTDSGASEGTSSQTVAAEFEAAGTSIESAENRDKNTGVPDHDLPKFSNQQGPPGPVDASGGERLTLDVRQHIEGGVTESPECRLQNKPLRASRSSRCAESGPLGSISQVSECQDAPGDAITEQTMDECAESKIDPSTGNLGRFPAEPAHDDLWQMLDQVRSQCVDAFHSGQLSREECLQKCANVLLEPWGMAGHKDSIERIGAIRAAGIPWRLIAERMERARRDEAGLRGVRRALDFCSFGSVNAGKKPRTVQVA